MHRRGLFEGVIDLLAAVKPSLAVVDAIIGDRAEADRMYADENPPEDAA
ncbi:MAG: hypothetical protein GY850_12620 [bacterium]|nr:hypothetical protein [bacterium]